MRKPLDFLWPIVEAVNPVVTPGALCRWPADIREQLKAANLLQPAGTSGFIRCPVCERIHKGEVIVRKTMDEKTRYFIRCPEALRAEISPKDMQMWIVDVSKIVHTIATSLSLSGDSKELASYRVWRCGRTMWQGTSRDVLFARGLARQDAGNFRRAITSCHHPIVLVPLELPSADYWQGRAHTVIAISEYAYLRDGQIHLEIEALVAAVRSADSKIESSVTAVIDQNDLKLLVRRQVKAEKKSELTDEMIVAAYVTHGSSRAAADALAKDGHSIHFSTVTRRVNRMKKSGELHQLESSDSVIRTVASQRRNGAKKIQNIPKTKD